MDIDHHPNLQLSNSELSEEKCQTLIANLSGIVYRCAGDRTMKFLGGAVLELTGFQSKEFINNQNRSWTSIIYSEDREMVDRVVTESLICRQPYSLEYRIVDAQGVIHWFCDKGRGVFTEDNQLLWLDGAIFDISDRKQFEIELLERVHLSILLAEIGSASIYTGTLEELIQTSVESLWRHLSINFAHIWTINTLGNGLDSQASAGQFNSADSDRLRNLIGKEKILFIAQGMFQSLVTDQILASLTRSEQLWLESKGIMAIEGYPLMVKERVIGVMFLASQTHLDTDIRLIDNICNAIALAIDRKQSEEKLKQSTKMAESANKARSLFLANMSHELRTPLNSILGFTQLILRDITPENSHHSYLKIIHNSGEHLLGLINDVLDMSKIESGRISLNHNDFDLYQFLDDLEKMFYLKANTQALQLNFKRSPQVPQWINTDEPKLRQILINLLSNAIKFTNRGAVTLAVEVNNLQIDNLQIDNLQITTANQINLIFVVQDTGEGIPDNELERIFEPFEQTDLGRKASEGTGLGLSISSKFAQLMGGKITVSSILGEGSIFEVNLPVIKPIKSPVSRPDQIFSNSFSELQNNQIIGLAPNQPEFRILVVEDRWESRHLLVKLLESVGFQIREAENGAEAISIWQEWQPHLIWMDIRMPVMDGYETTRQIKTTLNGQGTVIIALTASALEEEKTLILSAGCDDFVRKPFRESLIFDKLADYLGVIYLYESKIYNYDDINQKPIDLNILESNLQVSLPERPHSWTAKLHQAAMLADNDLILELIKDIPASNIVLSQSLISLMDNFCYNQIMNITKQALEKDRNLNE
jgi:signal transduction histidine kinase/CheY-like chemotaxis protein